MSIGFTLPFTVATGSLGYLQPTMTEREATRQNVKSLLVTNWGERPMRYYLGCNFREFLFEQLDSEDLENRVRDRILDQFSKWLPYLSVDSVNIIFPNQDQTLEQNSFKISLSYSFIGRVDTSDILEQVIV